MATTNKKAIFSLSLGHFMADMYPSCLVPLYPFIAAKLMVSLATISIIISLGNFLSTMLQPIFGFLADRTRHRGYMFWGLMLGAFFVPAVVFANNIYILGLCLTLAISGNALFHPQVMSMVSVFNHNNPNLNKYMGIFMGVGIIGYGIGPVLSSTLVGKFDSPGIFFITFLGVSIALFLYFSVPKIPVETVSTSKDNFFNVFSKILKNPALMSLMLLSVMKSLVGMSFGTYMPFLLKENGYGLSQIGIIITLFFLFSGVASAISVKIERKIGVKNLLRLSLCGILPMTALFVAAFAFHKLLALAIFVLMGFFIYLSASILIVLAQVIMPEHKAIVSGFIGGFSWAPASLCLIPLGYIAQNFGVKITLLSVAALAFLTGAFGIGKNLKEVFKKYGSVHL